MRIKKLELKNFRGFEELTIDFPEGESGLAVFVGVNGAGKSSLLDGIVSGLKVIQQNLKKGETERLGSWIQDDDVRMVAHEIGAKTTYEKQSEHRIAIVADFAGKEISWHFHQFGGGKDEVTQFTNKLKEETINGAKNVLPVFLYYSAQRYWSKKKEKVELYPIGSRLDTYIDCLEPKVSSQTLYEWFKRMKFIQFENEEGELPAELKEVRNAITKGLKSLNSYSDKKINIKFSVKNDEIEINTGNGVIELFRLLSDGLRSTLGMIGDIAYRMSEINPHIGNSSEGIVIIDEIDLHLHPAWQRTIISVLREVFPNIQFIVTTHSPQVLSNVPRENVFILNNFKLEENKPHTEGRDSNAILEDVFGVSSRPEEEKNELDELLKAIEKGEKEKAQKLYEVLKKKLGDRDLELQRAENYMELLID